MSILVSQSINTGYQNRQVIFDVNLTVNCGETILLIGSNGSGKSTFLKAIYGILPLWKNNNGRTGQVLLDGLELSNTPAFQLIKKKYMLIPQKKELFEELSVLENLKSSIIHFSDKNADTLNERLSDVFELFPSLKQLGQHRAANSLSGGERKMLSLGMVLLNKPKVLVYDEPLAGLSESQVSNVLAVLEQLKTDGLTLILVEHRIKEAFKLADRVLGFKLGRLCDDEIITIEDAKRFLV